MTAGKSIFTRFFNRNTRDWSFTILCPPYQRGIQGVVRVLTFKNQWCDPMQRRGKSWQSELCASALIGPGEKDCASERWGVHRVVYPRASTHRKIGMTCGSQTLHQPLNSWNWGRLLNPRKTGLHLSGNIAPRWPILKKAEFLICLPRCLTTQTSPWAVTARTRRAVTGPYCASYWRKGELSSDESEQGCKGAGLKNHNLEGKYLILKGWSWMQRPSENISSEAWPSWRLVGKCDGCFKSQYR